MTHSPQLSLGLELTDGTTFNNFIVGRNEELVRLLQSFATLKSDRYLYIWGAKGSGKSHLLQAVCQSVIEAQNSVIYVNLAEASTYSECILEGLETLSLVCIDNIQAVAGQSNWENALFILYDSILSNGGRLLIAGDDHPNQLGFQLSDLVSRLCWGQAIKVQPLEDHGLISAMQQRAAVAGLELPEEVSQFILNRITRDMNALSEVFATLNHASLVEQRKLTVPFVKKTLQL